MDDLKMVSNSNIKKGNRSRWNDETISPAIQTLQHWGYKLTKKDFEKELKNRGL